MEGPVANEGGNPSVTHVYAHLAGKDDNSLLKAKWLMQLNDPGNTEAFDRCVTRDFMTVTLAWLHFQDTGPPVRLKQWFCFARNTRQVIPKNIYLYKPKNGTGSKYHVVFNKVVFTLENKSLGSSVYIVLVQSFGTRVQALFRMKASKPKRQSKVLFYMPVQCGSIPMRSASIFKMKQHIFRLLWSRKYF